MISIFCVTVQPVAQLSLTAKEAMEVVGLVSSRVVSAREKLRVVSCDVHKAH